MNNSKMDLQIEALIKSISSLTIDETKIIKIQKWFRECSLRLKKLPQPTNLSNKDNDEIKTYFREFKM